MDAEVKNSRPSTSDRYSQVALRQEDRRQVARRTLDELPHSLREEGCSIDVANRTEKG